MFTIIGGDGQEYGPVPTEQVKRWLAEGRANLSTKARRVGEETWGTLGDFAEFSASGAPALPPAPVPAAPSAPEQPGPAQARMSPERFTSADRLPDYELNIGEVVSRGWTILTGNFWLAVGATALVTLCTMAVSMIPFLIGTIANAVLGQVFYAGLYFFYLRLDRGEAVEIGQAFAGFSKHTAKLILLGLLVFGISLGLMLIAALPVGIVLLSNVLAHGGNPDLSTIAGWPLILSVIVALPVVCFLVYLSVSWVLAPILVIDQGLGPWTALQASRKLVSKQWLAFFLLFLVFIPIHFAGLLCFLVGIFVTLALFYATVAVAYRTAIAENQSGAAKPGAFGFRQS